MVLDKKIEHFSFKDCRFAMEREKEATARMVIFNELQIIHSYTLEASFYGSEIIEYEEVEELIEEFKREDEGEIRKNNVSTVGDISDEENYEKTILNQEDENEQIDSSPYKTITVEKRRKVVYTPERLIKFGEDFCK